MNNHFLQRLLSHSIAALAVACVVYLAGVYSSDPSLRNISEVPASNYSESFLNLVGLLQPTDKKVIATPVWEQFSSNEYKAFKSLTARFRPHILNAAFENDLDPDLVSAVILVESRSKVRAKSHAGAMGLMQLMPITARELGVKDPYDPKQNINGGAKYLGKMLKRFDGNLSLALAAYNAGPGTVERYHGIPPYRETQNYVTSVVGTYNILQGRKRSATP